MRDSSYFPLVKALGFAVKDLIDDTTDEVMRLRLETHMANTASRVADMYSETFWGLTEDPAKDFTVFANGDRYDQMIIVAKVEFESWCAHHLLPFFGRYTFAYIPDKSIIGLSKIPRMMEVLCARPQIQEILSDDAVNLFQAKVKPLGCAIVIDGLHTCMCARGVKKVAVTRTTSLRGCFANTPESKTELLSAVGPIPELR